ncbi:MAG: protein kinase, partial [Gemmatimonadota bacterium]
EIGRGGMATVYLARDLKHDRKVAIKVLRPELAAAVGPDRFLLEIAIAARLNHLHILGLHESGEADGFLYYVMPNVEGESLRARLTREKQLAIDEAVALTGQVASALDYAHGQGVIHRDIKPENILLHRGEAVVADFGIALALTAAGADRLTGTGLSLGTPEYMSPEQATGDPLDARTDQYSLACVLYEMLAGEPPFTGRTSQAVMAKRFADPAPSVKRLREHVPAAVDGALQRALSRTPADRFVSTRAFSDALSAEKARTGSAIKSIVVLPFESLSPDPENEFFTDGLTDELIADLSLVKSLRVISRTSAMQLKGTQKALRTICSELDVQYVLEGSVRRAGDDLRITAQLIEAERDAHLWTKKYTGSVEDVFDIQEKVSRAIVDALKVALRPEEDRRLASRPVDDLAAYECLLRARHQIFLGTEESLDEALELLERGLARVPDSAALHAWRAFALVWHINSMNKEPADYPAFLKSAQHLASRALALDPDDSTARFAQGAVYWFGGNPCEAVEWWCRAIETNPNDVDALHLLGFALIAGGCELDRARSLLVRCRQLDPLNLIYASVDSVYPPWYRGQFRQVLDETEVAWWNLPSPLNRLFRGHFHTVVGELDQAFASFDEIVRDTPENPHAALGAFLQHALRGEREQALEAVTEKLEQAAWWDDYFPVLMADGYVMIGNVHRALHWVDRAIDMGTTNVAFLGEHEPFLRRMRGDPRFEALLDKAQRRSEALKRHVELPDWV